MGMSPQTMFLCKKKLFLSQSVQIWPHTCLVSAVNNSNRVPWFNQFILQLHLACFLPLAKYMVLYTQASLKFLRFKFSLPPFLTLGFYNLNPHFRKEHNISLFSRGMWNYLCCYKVYTDTSQYCQGQTF